MYICCFYQIMTDFYFMFLANLLCLRKQRVTFSLTLYIVVCGNISMDS